MAFLPKPGPGALCIALVLTITVVCVCAQPREQYEIIHYTDENGLPQNSVNAIAPDAKGFLWLATESGLVRFDGQSFFTFDKTLLNIAQNRIRYFLPPAGRPVSDEPLFYSCDGISSFLGIYPDSYAKKTSGYPWEKVKSSLSRTMGANTSLIVSLPNVFGPYDVDTLKSPDLGILPIANNRYYLRKNGQLALYEGEKKIFGLYFPRNQDLLFNGGQLYAAQKDGSLYRIDKGGALRLTLTGDILQNSSYLNKEPTYFWNNVTQQVFIYLNKQLYSVKTDAGHVVTRLLAPVMDLNQHGVISIFLDDWGNIFLGCRTEGLYLLKRKQFSVLTVPGDSAGSVFYAGAAAGENRLITRQGYLLDLSTGRPVPGQQKAKLGHYWSWYFLPKDKSGHLWVLESTSPIDRQLAQYSADGKTFLGNWDVPGAIDGAYCDPFGLTWFQTDEGKIYYIKNNGRSKSKPVFFINLPVSGIHCYHRTGRQLWLGTGTGLHVLDLATRKVASVKALAGKHVRNIYGSGNQLWLCTYGDGLYLYQDRKLTHFPLDEDKYISSAHCIVADSLGHFWISTNKGLFQISKSDLMAYAAGKTRTVFYHYFDKSSGFNTNEFNGGCQPCGVALKSGKIAFPSLNGFVYFNPYTLNTEYPNKSIVVKEVLVDGQSVAFYEGLTVRRDFQQLQVQVSTPYFGNPRNVKFHYRISSEDNQGAWIPVAKDNRIYITGMPPGNYRLDIRKVSGFGINNFTYAKLGLTVPPYWYETREFAAFVVVLIAVVIYFLLRIRSRYVRIQSYNNNLVKNARLYGDIITSINHDIQTPLYYAIYSVEQLTERLSKQEPTDTIFSKMGTEAVASLRRISTLTNNLLHYLKVNIYQHNHSIATSPMELRTLVSDIVEMFSAKIDRDGIRILNQIPVGAEYELPVQLFPVILHNLIDNAVKVSRQGVISLSIEQYGDIHRLVIADSGKGMPAQIARWLMDTGSQPINADRNPGKQNLAYSGGLGLIIVKDLCRLSGITLTVKSVKEDGTFLYLTLTHLKTYPRHP